MYECSRCGGLLDGKATICDGCGSEIVFEVTPEIDNEDDDGDEFVSVLEFDDEVDSTQPDLSPPGSRRPRFEPTTEQSVTAPGELAANSEAEARRWYHLLEESPVFAHDVEEVATTEITEHRGSDPNLALDIALEPRFEMASAPSGSDPVVHMLLTIAPEGEPIVDADEGPVAHVILALDLSASMNDPLKYPKLTQALRGMLYHLQAPDSAEVLISVVLFAYGAKTLIRAQPASQIDARDLIRRIDEHELLFGRYTDVVGALDRAGRIAFDSHRRNRAMPIRISLLTDGRPQDMEGARAKMKTLARLPVDVDALAFGDDADVAAMQELVSGGRGGTVKHIRSDSIEDAFGRIAEVAQRVVAKRALIDFELCSGIVGGAAYRYRPGRHSYGKSAFKGGRRFTTDLGTLESGRRYSLLFQIRLPRTVASETEVGRITLRVPGYGGPRTFECPLGIARHPGANEPTKDPQVTEALEILEAMDIDDPAAKLKALHTRRRLYEAERRDPYLLRLIDKAIAEIQNEGSLDSLSKAERASLLAHTCTVVLSAPERDDLLGSL